MHVSPMTTIATQTRTFLLSLDQGGRDKAEWETFQKTKFTELNKIVNMKCPQDSCTGGLDHLFGFIIFTLSEDLLKPLIFRELAYVAPALFGVMLNPIDFGEGTQVYCGFGDNTAKLTDRRPRGVARLVETTFCGGLITTQSECVSAYVEKLSSGLRLPCKWSAKDAACSESSHEICDLEKTKCGNILASFCSLQSSSEAECTNSRSYIIRSGRTVPCIWTEDKSCVADEEGVCDVEEVKCGAGAEAIPGAEAFQIRPKGSVPIKSCRTATGKATFVSKMKAKLARLRKRNKVHEDDVFQKRLREAFCMQYKKLVASGHAEAPCELTDTGDGEVCLASGKQRCLPDKDCGVLANLLPTKPDARGNPCEDFSEKNFPKRNKDKSKRNPSESKACVQRYYKDETGFYHSCVYRKKTGFFGVLSDSHYGCWTIPAESTPCHYTHDQAHRNAHA